MRLLKHKHTRIGALIVCLSLIGGTGCITSAIIENARQKEAMQKYADQQKKTVDGYKVNAAKGDLFAITRLGLEYISGSQALPQDIPAGIQLLEQAVEKQYALAEYSLGWLLLAGRDSYHWKTLTTDQLPRQTDRGILLLKLSATRACAVSETNDGRSGNTPAFDISKVYREGRLVAKDLDQANLWLARSVIHCRYPNIYVIKSTFPTSKSAPLQAQIDLMSWILLIPADSANAKKMAIDSQPVLAPEDLAKAQTQAAHLRQIVLDSEKQYPAPPQPTYKP